MNNQNQTALKKVDTANQKQKAEDMQATFRTIGNTFDEAMKSYGKLAGDLPANSVCYTENEVRRIVFEFMKVLTNISCESIK